MKKAVTSWDDIPSLELEMEDSSQEKTIESRRFDRIDSDVMKGLLYKDVAYIPIKVATMKGIFDGKIEDLSQNGVQVSVPIVLEKNESVKVAFEINSRRIVTKAITRWVRKNKSNSVAGIEFISPNQKDVDFIESMGCASRLNNVGNVKNREKTLMKMFYPERSD